MKTPIAVIVAAVFGGCLSASPMIEAKENKSAVGALADGQANILMRLRYERVDQDNLKKDANGLTLLTRLSYKSGTYNGFFGVLEADNVTAIGSKHYNSTVNGKSQYPVIADPTGTELNQAYVGYKSDNLTLTMGRQRIVHNNQRFVGGVAWRQNEQTYDGYRIQYTNNTNLNVDYSFVHNVNRIFGTQSSKGNLDGSLHLFNLNYSIGKQHRLSGFAYNLDFDYAHALSTRTVGVSYDGKASGFKIHASFANQADTGDNPTDFSANYYALEVGTKISAINIALGYESLGSDNGKGFSTPLATLHKFQGYSDKFLATPGNGVKDLYIKASGKLGKVTLVAVLHDLRSAKGSIDYGNELNLVAKYPLAEKLGLLVKYANYSADSYSVDTNKLWAMLTFKL